MVVDGRPAHAGGAVHPHVRRSRAFARGQSAGGGAARARAVLFRQSPRALSGAGDRGSAGHLVSANAAHPPPCAPRLHRKPGAHGAHAGLRRGGGGGEALESFLRGGWFGRGPGEGTVKRVLPESHADFVFAVAAEEFGIVLCLVLVALFAFIVLRALSHAMRDQDPFRRFATAGLAILFGLQSAINMAVNLHLMPAKGMTLPFISYGGSSMISIAHGMGVLPALSPPRPPAGLLASQKEIAPRGGPA